jgi:hypothetical protein
MGAEDGDGTSLLFPLTCGPSNCFPSIPIELVLIRDEGKLRAGQVLGNVRLRFFLP